MTVTCKYQSEVEAVRLAVIEDLIDAAEEQGVYRVSLDIDDARWLVAEKKKDTGGDVRPVDLAA